MRLHLVRHGESTWNVAGRVQGQTPHPVLTRAGATQARVAAERLAAVGADVLVTSDLRRAAQTARVVGAVLGLEPRLEPALREQALGDLEGRSAASLSAQATPVGVHVTDVRWGGPSSESIADVYARVGAYLSGLSSRPPGEDVVLVSHAETIRAALAWVRGAPPHEVDWSPVPHGSVHTVEVPTSR